MEQERQVECEACGEQSKFWQTDSGHCRSCGGECRTIEELYGPGGIYYEGDEKEKK